MWLADDEKIADIDLVEEKAQTVEGGFFTEEYEVVVEGKVHDDVGNIGIDVDGLKVTIADVIGDLDGAGYYGQLQ